MSIKINQSKKVTVLKQISKLILRNFAQKLASKYGEDKQLRAYVPWNYALTLIYALLSQSFLGDPNQAFLPELLDCVPFKQPQNFLSIKIKNVHLPYKVYVRFSEE